MRRKIIIWAVLAMTLLILLNSMAGLSSAQEKKVTEKAIIWIHNVYDLQNMSKNLSGHYALANDIDATITHTWNNGSGFVPIGNSSVHFTGTFDGIGHKIINLYINRSSENYTGLFGDTSSNVVIENVSLMKVYISGNYWVGGLVGVNRGIVKNSYVSGNICGGWDVGGVVGWNYGTVNNSYATGNISGGGDNIGGLVGMNYNGTISYSYVMGNISGNNTVGGLVGVSNNGIVSNSYAKSNVSGRGVDVSGLVGDNNGIVNNSYATGYVKGVNTVGGLVGVNTGIVNNSYAMSNVSGSEYVGGLVGENWGTVSNSYSTGNVSGSNYVGGLVGESDYGTVTASFWDVNTTGQTTSDGGVGKTTEEMKNKTTFLNAGWDFTNIWGIIDGQTYPYLLWSTVPRELKAEAGNGFVNLIWKAPANKDGAQITEYNIYRNGAKIATVPATQLWYNDTNVVNGQTYTYYVTAVNEAGESPKSNEVQATPGGTIPEITPGIIIIVALLSLIIALRKRKN